MLSLRFNGEDIGGNNLRIVERCRHCSEHKDSTTFKSAGSETIKQLTQSDDVRGDMVEENRDQMAFP
jgi:hypothetical protein